MVQENKEKLVDEQLEDSTEEVVEDAQDQETDLQEELPEDTIDNSEPENKKEASTEKVDEELELKRKRYKERAEERKKSKIKSQEDLHQQVDSQLDERKSEAKESQKIQYLERVAARIEFNEKFSHAKKELAVYEKDFSEAYPDYTDQVTDALEFVEMNLMNQGLSEQEARAQAEKEKVLLADAAVREGKDPVEELYKEAISINKLVHGYAKKKGYIKTDKRKNLNSARKASKPNAISSGKGSSGITNSLDDDDNFDLNDMTLEQMLQAKRNGQI